MFFLFNFDFFCYLAWAVDLGFQITDVGRSLYIGSFCPAMTSLSRYLEEAAFNILISSSMFIFLRLFSRCIMNIVSSVVFISWPIVKDVFREFGFAFCVSEVFPTFFESCVEVSVGSSYMKFVAGYLKILITCRIQFCKGIRIFLSLENFFVVDFPKYCGAGYLKQRFVFALAWYILSKKWVRDFSTLL